MSAPPGTPPGSPEVPGRPGDVLATLAAQSRHQVRLLRQWMSWWVPVLFGLGLAVAILGLIPTTAAFLEQGSPPPSFFLFALFTLFFGWVVALTVMGPFPQRPRIVPYFARELGKLGGETQSAFRRGRGLYREIAGLEELARRLQVRPLSSFGFADDYFEQEVHWHAAAEGLRTVEALQQQLDAPLRTARYLAEDLEALAQALRVATDQEVAFSLVLRLRARDSLQAVCTREVRQGSFW